MTENQHCRTEWLIGKLGIQILRDSRVAVFGLGGVGGMAAEALARAGVGNLDLVDHDVVDETNLNRQILALHSTIGMPKTQVMAQRIKDINPEILIVTHPLFFLPETSKEIDFAQYDYIVDAIDNVTGKLELIRCAQMAGTPIISSMGTGNKMSGDGFRVADIGDTAGCPLAKVMRKELKKMGIQHVPVVYSPEVPLKQRPPGSISFVPPVAGLLMAGTVIRTLLSKGENINE